METAPSEETSAVPQPTDTTNLNHAKVSVIMDDIEAAATKLDLKLVTFHDLTRKLLNPTRIYFWDIQLAEAFQAMET